MRRLHLSDEPGVVFKSRGIMLAIALVAALVILSAFAAGYAFAMGTVNSSIPNLNVFMQAYDLANSQFYYTKPSAKDQMYGAINGLLATYKDQFTFLEQPDTAAANNQVMEGASGGIGARIEINKDNQLVIIQALYGKPAAVAGVKDGDIILTVDGQTTQGQDLNVILNRIRGPIGTQVKLTLKRAGAVDPVAVTITRDQINVYGEMLNSNTAYISLSLFSKTSPQEVKDALTHLLTLHPDALILDLRGNPGGYLDQALQIADLFLPAGKIASEKSSTGENETFNAVTGDIGESIPMVVLIDKDSASAAEIVSGALQDRGRAVLLGQKSYGKGSVQTLFSLSDGSQLRITHGAWYTPNDQPIQKNGQHLGLNPDVFIPLPATPNPDVDTVLNAAEQYIKSQLVVTF